MCRYSRNAARPCCPWTLAACGSMVSYEDEAALEKVRREKAGPFAAEARAASARTSSRSWSNKSGVRFTS